MDFVVYMHFRPNLSLSLSTRRRLDALPATWPTTAASSPTLAQEDYARLTLVRFSSVWRGPTSATEPSVPLDLVFGTVCRRTSDSRTCHKAVTRHCYWVNGTRAQCEPPHPLLTAFHKSPYLLVY